MRKSRFFLSWLSDRVACVTGGCFKGRMENRLEKVLALGRMRVMAASAIDRFGRNSDMCGLEGIVFQIMTDAAQLRDGLRVERDLLRGVWSMASEAVPQGRRMGLLGGESFFDGLVAAQAEIGAIGQKELLQLSLVRAVALAALAGRSGLVPALALLDRVPDVRVASEAERSLRLGEHPGFVGSMGIVTDEAHSLLERKVRSHARRLLHEIAVAGHAEPGIAGFEQLGFVGTMRFVARVALSIQHWLVGVRLDEARFGVRVTAEANPVHRILHHSRKTRTVRIVAG